MSAKPERIKLKLGLSEKTTNYYKSLLKWEGEGGATSSDVDLSQIDLPISKGDEFKVLSGAIAIDDDEIVYIADIQKISD